MQIDFGRTVAEHVRHRAGFPDALYDRLATAGIGAPGQCLLDLGTGTGTLARGFARRGAVVTGLDKSEPLIAAARQIDHEAGITVTYVHGSAEETGLPDGAFDGVTAGQCWQWFHRAKAAAEALRVLMPGGRIAICHFDWLPLHGNVVAATEALILQFNPTWPMAGGSGIYPAWPADVAQAGFRELETFSFDVDVPYTPEAWRGRIKAAAGVLAGLSPDAAHRFDDRLGEMLARDFPAATLHVPHRCWALVARAP